LYFSFSSPFAFLDFLKPTIGPEPSDIAVRAGRTLTLGNRELAPVTSGTNSGHVLDCNRAVNEYDEG
jgi:hypothetical protein